MNSVRSRRGHWITMTAAAFLSLFLFASGVCASTSGTNRRLITVSSAAWRAVAVPANTPPTNQPLVLNWAVSHGTAYQFFDIVNNGSIDVSSQTFHVTNVLDKNGNMKAPTVTFDACLNGTWTAINTCSGTVQQLGSTTTEIFTTVNTYLSVGSRIHIQATTTPSGSSSYTTTVNISIDRSQVRASLTSNL